MKHIYFVTATNTDVGKSYACEVLLKRFSKTSKVGYFKPIETGVIDTPIDGTKLLNLTQQLNPEFDYSIQDIVPYQFTLPAAPFVANQTEKDIDISLILEKAKQLLNKCDTLLVEGAGGLMVPILKDYFMIDLIKEFQDSLQAKTILIAPSNLGSINDTLLSQKALNSYKIEYQWYINLYKDKESFDSVTLPFYENYFEKIDFLEN